MNGRAMTQFDMNAAWKAATAYWRVHAAMLLTVIGGGVLVATLVQYGLFGFSDAAFQARLAAIGDSDPARLWDEFGTTMLPMVLIAGVVQGAAQFAALRQMLADEPWPRALGYGAGAALLQLLFWTLLFAALVVALALLFTLLGVSLDDSEPSAGAALAMLVVLIAVPPLTLWLAARLSVMAPAMAAVRSANPLYGFSQSWHLTAPVQGRLMLYFLLLGIAALVAILVLSLIGGAFALLVGDGLGEGLAAIVTGVPLGIASLVVTAGIHAVLAPRPMDETFV